MSTSPTEPDSSQTPPGPAESGPVAAPQPPAPPPATSEATPKSKAETEADDRLTRYLKGPTAFCA